MRSVFYRSSLCMLLSTVAWAQEAPTLGFALGDQAIAIGESSIATGQHALAVGAGAVATGNNMTPASIRQQLEDNKARLQAIEDQRIKLQHAQADFEAKNAIWLQVQHADNQIAERRERINHTLSPELEAARQKVRDNLPQWEAKQREAKARNANLAILEGFDLGKASTTDGLEALAQELKTKAEEGYQHIINEDIAFYKDYISTYIKANGELPRNRYWRSRAGIGEVGSPFVGNPAYLFNNLVGYQNPHSDFLLPRVFKSGQHTTLMFANDLMLDGRSIDIFSDQVLSLTQAQKDDLNQQLQSKRTQVEDWFQHADFFLAKTPEGRQQMMDRLDKMIEYYKAGIEIKFYQGEYERKGGGTNPEALQALQEKRKWETQRDERRQAVVDDHFWSKISFAYVDWTVENIDNVEQKNSAFIQAFREQLDRILSEEKARHDELLAKEQQAQAALDAIEREIAQLTPSQTQREQAAQSEAARDTVRNEEDTLNRLVADLSLHDLRNIGKDAIAVGRGTLVTGNQAVGLGADNVVTGNQAVAVGVGNIAFGEHDVVVGANSHTSPHGDHNVLIGHHVRLEDSADAPVRHSVGLGSNTVVAPAVGTASMDIRGVSYALAGGAPVGTVSVGASGKERTITHVAAGRVSETSTDAVNGSQLHALRLALDNLSPVTNPSGAGATSPDNRRLAQQVATHLGGGAHVDANANVSAPTYRVQQGNAVADFHNVGDAIAQLDRNQQGLSSQLRDATVQWQGNVAAANAGIAAAMAVGNLGQSWRPGQSSFSLSGAIYQGQGGYAFGLTRLSEDGKWLIKGVATGNSQYNFGAGLSGTYYWE